MAYFKVKQIKKRLDFSRRFFIKYNVFKLSVYNKVTAIEVMRKPSMLIDTREDIITIMRKFEESGHWNLPVVENEIYIGFLSKSIILDKYRHELLETL